MKQSTKRLLYTLYFLSLAGALLYYLFPGDTLSGYLLFRAKKLFPNLTATIGSIKPTIPPGVTIKQIDLAGNDGHAVKIDKMVVSPGIVSLFKAQRTLHFQAEAYSGDIKGHLAMESGTDTQLKEAQVTLADIMLQQVGWLRAVTNREILGTLGGRLLYDQNAIENTMRASFTITDLSIGLRAPVLDLQKMDFASVESDLIGNQSNLRVNRFIFQGEKLDGSLTGLVSLKAPIEKSTLDLSGSIKLEPEFFAYLRENLPDLPMFKKKSGNKRFPIRISGTLDKPGFALK